jgi:protein-L-isoaspartate O-methyltransferase
MTPTFFEQFPQVNNLRSLVSDELILQEIGVHAESFLEDYERAKKNIPSVNLNKIFPKELDQNGIYLENFLGHWGNISIEEACKICLIVKFMKPKKILEIGTYNGMTTLQMALNAPSDCQVYTLDLDPETAKKAKLSELDRLVSQHFSAKFGSEVGSYFKNRNDLNIQQLLGDSTQFDYSTIGNDFDIIFIDAAHDYVSKKIDSENAFKLIKKGGIVIWHNYADVVCPNVTKYLADISDNYKIYHLRNTYLAIYIHEYE